MTSKVIVVGVALIFVVLVPNETVQAFEIELKDPLRMQQGLGWPHTLTVVVGHDALMKLVKTTVNQQSCEVTTPFGETFFLSSPPSNRYEVWSHACSMRVRKVSIMDYGRWRLTSSNGSHTFTGWIEVYVEEDTNIYEPPPISLLDGEQNPDLDLVSLDNSYCLVAQPFSQSSLIPGHCRVSLNKATRAVQGNWDILVGLPGRIAELQIDRKVQVNAERLDVGFIFDSNTNRIHLYCNILHTSKNVTFCRFQKTTQTIGYNVMEGLSDGLHSYYGEGFVAKHCGLTIEKPTNADFGTWRCSVGSQLRVGNAVEQQTPVQALINVPPHAAGRGASLYSEKSNEDGSEVKTLFVQANLTFTIPCHVETSLTYCWFLHPNGTQFTPLPLTSEDQQFWYSGESLQIGDCVMTFAHARIADAGDWTCHMGAKNELGIELTDRVHVRVTGSLAANKKEIRAVIGETTTIHCHTSNGNKPLDYCRFLSPTFEGIHLDDSVIKENAILRRYYFTPERLLRQGDCSLSIISVREEDVGQWTCAAVVNGDTVESSDTATIRLGEGPRRLSRAGIAGMAVGISVLLALLGGVAWYKYGPQLPSIPWPTRVERVSEQQNIEEPRLPYDIVSFRTNSSNRHSVATNDSDGSNSTVENNPNHNE